MNSDWVAQFGDQFGFSDYSLVFKGVKICVFLPCINVNTLISDMYLHVLRKL